MHSKIHFRKIRPVNLYYNYTSIGNFKNMYPLAVSIYHVIAERLSWTLSVLHIRKMNGVILWYVSVALQCLFHFIACVLFLSISVFLFLLCVCVCVYVCVYVCVCVESATCWGIKISLSINVIKTWSCC